MIGFFIIKSFDTQKDSAGAEVMARVKSQMDHRIEGELYLPPYLRRNQSNISENSVVFGVLDDISGFGAAICGIDGADYGYFLNADLNIKKSLIVDDKITATNDIETTAGDVIALNISLKNHVHQIVSVSSVDAAAIVAAAASGTVATTAMVTGSPL